MSLVQKLLKNAPCVLVVGGFMYLSSFGLTQVYPTNVKSYQADKMPITGTILAVNYGSDLVPSPAISGIFYTSPETVKLKSYLTLSVRTDDGMTLGVVVVDSLNSPDKKKDGLAAIVREGSRVSFPRDNISLTLSDIFGFVQISYPYTDDTQFNRDTRFGAKRADRITVIDP